MVKINYRSLLTKPSKIVKKANFNLLLCYMYSVSLEQQPKLTENQRLSRACIVHLVIKRTNWSYVKTMSCRGSHLGIPINIKKTFLKDLPMIDKNDYSWAVCFNCPCGLREEAF